MVLAFLLASVNPAWAAEQQIMGNTEAPQPTVSATGTSSQASTSMYSPGAVIFMTRVNPGPLSPPSNTNSGVQNDNVTTNNGGYVDLNEETTPGYIVGVIPYQRGLSAGTYLRETEIESLKGMKNIYLTGTKLQERRMASAVQAMVTFLEKSATSLGGLNNSGVEITIEKKEDGTQINTLNVMNRDGTTATLRITYPASGDVPKNVTFATGSILENGKQMSVQSIRKYVALYGDDEAKSSLEKNLQNLKKGGKITGFFYYCAPVPAASWMSFTSITTKRDGSSVDRTLQVWGNGYAAYMEWTTSKPMPVVSDTISPTPRRGISHR